MTVFIATIDLIRRIDQLIILQRTVTPEQLAARLAISRTKLYRIIALMKMLDAPISYNASLQSYVYDKAARF